MFVVNTTVLMDMLIQQVGIDMEMFFGIVFLMIMGTMVYIGIVISEEKRQGKYIPLIWEKDFWK